MTRILYKLIGERIRHARTEKELTQEKLAQQVGLTSSSISNIELGTQSVQLHDLYRIAEALEKDVNQLIPTLREVKEAMPSVEREFEKLSSTEREFIEKKLIAKVRPKEEA